MNIDEKIMDLLQSQQAVNNALAYNFIQSQWKWTKEEALQFIFDYQVEHYFTPTANAYKFGIGDVWIEYQFYFDDEDGYAVSYEHVYLIVEVLMGDEKMKRSEFFVTSKMGRGSINYFDINLMNVKDLAQTLFLQIRPKILEFLNRTH